MPVQYAVISQADAWCLFRGGQKLREFQAKDDAVAAARALADGLSSSALVEVLIQSDAGELQPDRGHEGTQRALGARWAGEKRSFGRQARP